MSGTHRILVGVVAMLSLLGVGGAATAATPDSASLDSAPVVMSNRWCC